MPTNKPIIQTVIDEELYKKYKKICEKEERKLSDMTRIIIKRYIEQYEKDNGNLDPKSSFSKTG